MNRGMNNVWTLVLSAAVIYGVLAILMGVLPGLALSHTAPTPGLQPLAADAERGRAVYVGEGCEYCHTQNVRPLKQDLVFGRPSVAGDYAFSTPELLGDHRNGPDLSNIGNRQPSGTWQYMHLWNPRAVVSGSIMPSYSWLFTVKKHADAGDLVVNIPPGFAPHGVVVAKQSAKDLVAYLLALKQVPLKKSGSTP